MADSLFVPIKNFPENIDQIRNEVSAAFSEFGMDPPSIYFSERSVANPTLENALVIAEGIGPDDYCWVGISQSTADITEDPEYTIIVNIETRGNWVFGGILAYSFCRYHGRKVINDSLRLDGMGGYTVDSLRRTLVSLIQQG
ncbi:hypothetical protein [Lysobacter capsici]|jgi:hypothetical protein|uniref:hypothetical protein n=1 Tax=Lysobacter capsici TaxID=435897 RepID=UPI00128D6354|nr:hypothetical protein [Lysobacter capsici]